MEADYDIPATLAWLASLPPPPSPPLRVALQWPDTLLGDALEQAAALTSLHWRLFCYEASRLSEDADEVQYSVDHSFYLSLYRLPAGP